MIISYTDLTIRKELIATIDLRQPEIFNLTISEEQLWSSKTLHVYEL